MCQAIVAILPATATAASCVPRGARMRSPNARSGALVGVAVPAASTRT